MPKNLLTEISRGSLELENDTLDMDDIETAYEEGDDEMANRTQDEQEEFNAQ